MPKETALRELQELTGTYRGITTNKLFTEITVGGNSIMMETERPNTKAIVGQLQKIGKGTKIGILKFNGTFKLRRCKSE